MQLNRKYKAYDARPNLPLSQDDGLEYLPPDAIMATSTADVLHQNQVSPSISADNALKFLEEHGYFPLKYAKIGELVNSLYLTGNAKKARRRHFEPTLRQHPVSRPSDVLTSYLPLVGPCSNPRPLPHRKPLPFSMGNDSGLLQLGTARKTSEECNRVYARSQFTIRMPGQIARS